MSLLKAWGRHVILLKSAGFHPVFSLSDSPLDGEAGGDLLGSYYKISLRFLFFGLEVLSILL